MEKKEPMGSNYLTFVFLRKFGHKNIFFEVIKSVKARIYLSNSNDILL